MAARAAGPPDELRAVRPGQIGGSYRPLGDDQVQAVYRTALDLLDTVGMADPIPVFVELVTGAGGELDDAGRLRFPPELVETCIATAAKEIHYPGFDPARSLDLSGSRVHFGTAGAAVLMLDLEDRTYRPSTLLDLYDLSRLADTLEHIHFFVRPVVARDMETAQELDLNTAYAAMMGTTKPIGTSFFAPEHVYQAVEMFDLALGGEGEFRKRPFCSANNTFVVPPLRFARESCECLVAQVETGMIVNLLSAGQAGATSPAALAGALAQGLAECLAGLVVVNLLSPGHPAIIGLWPFVSDLRTGAMSGGSGEEALLNAAAAQVVNDLGLPSGVAAGMADSKLPDNQAGYEKGITVVLAAAAGANLIYESAGMLGSILGCSLEAFVIDNDMMGSINRTVRGLEVSPDSLSAEVIAGVVAGEGHFLGHPQTLALMQRDYVYPAVGDRTSPKDWQDQGRVDILTRAKVVVGDTLRNHHPGHVSPEADDEIRRRFPIRLPRAELTGASSRWR